MCWAASARAAAARASLGSDIEEEDIEEDIEEEQSRRADKSVKVQILWPCGTGTFCLV